MGHLVRQNVGEERIEVEIALVPGARTRLAIGSRVFENFAS
jgi:hypothetical protein